MTDLFNIEQCCASCEHLYKMITEEPCYICDNRNPDTSKWEPNEYLRNLKEKGSKKK